MCPPPKQRSEHCESVMQAPPGVRTACSSRRAGTRACGGGATPGLVTASLGAACAHGQTDGRGRAGACTRADKRCKNRATADGRGAHLCAHAEPGQERGRQQRPDACAVMLRAPATVPHACMEQDSSATEKLRNAPVGYMRPRPRPPAVSETASSLQAPLVRQARPAVRAWGPEQS